MASDRTKAIRPPAQTGTADGGERIAIFFGAGASKAFGYPLVGELLPCLRDAAFHSMPSHWDYSREDHETLRAGLKSVYPQVDTCPAEQLPPITDLLSLIDHADRSGSSLFSVWPRHQVDRFRVLVENAIGEMVGPDIAQTDDQRRCAEKVARAITGAADRVQLGIVTTNYDIEIDRALFRHYGELNVANAIDFGMSWRDPNPEEARIYPRPQKPRVSLLKLHGSLNWLRCPLCEYIYINVYGVIVGWATEDTPSGSGGIHWKHSRARIVGS